MTTSVRPKPSEDDWSGMWAVLYSACALLLPTFNRMRELGTCEIALEAPLDHYLVERANLRLTEFKYRWRFVNDAMTPLKLTLASYDFIDGSTTC